jgi:hypothetical protein
VVRFAFCVKHSGTAKALSSDCLNHIYSIRRQFQRTAFKVLLHVISTGCAGERQNADGARKSEDQLGGRCIDLCGKSGDGRVAQDLHIRGEKREALVDDVSLAAESAHFAVPAPIGITTVLYKRRRFRMGPGHLLQLGKRNVADAKKVCAPGVAFFNHGLPGFKILCGPVRVRSGAVENKAVHVVRAEMLKRTGHRLRNLDGKSCGRIVRQAMVLTILIGELGLEKNVGAGNYASAIDGGQSLSDSGFKVVAALVGRVDAAKSRADGEFS